MTPRMDKKGQTALETAFVVLFIITAVWTISARTMRYTEGISKMSVARAVAQGVALELSMKGIKTNLVRIDENASGGTFGVDLYVVSEGPRTGECSDQVKNNFMDSLDDAGIAIKKMVCVDALFRNLDLCPDPGDMIPCSCTVGLDTYLGTRTCLSKRLWGDCVTAFTTC